MALIGLHKVKLIDREANMKTPEIFDEWLLECATAGYNLGRRFHPIPKELADIFEYHRALFENRMKYLRTQMHPERSIEIYGDFTDLGRFQAGAGVYKGMGMIEAVGMVGITKGAILLTVEMFNRMLSHPAVLEGVGEPKLEKFGPQHREGMPDDYNSLVENRRKAGQQLLWRSPICPIRRGVAATLIDLCLRFITIHEINHILYGHFEYLNRVRNLAIILEVQNRRQSPSPSRALLDLQALELSADNMAAKVVMNWFIKKGSEFWPVDATRDPKNSLFLWSFAMLAMFRLWGLTVDPDDIDEGHPPPALRFETMMAGTCWDIAASIPEIGDDGYMSCFTEVAAATERAIAYCGGEGIAPADYVGTFDPKVRERMNRLYAHHNDVLMSELEKFAHIDLRPLGSN